MLSDEQRVAFCKAELNRLIRVYLQMIRKADTALSGTPWPQVLRQELQELWMTKATLAH